MPELVLNDAEKPKLIHCHENLDQLPQGLPKTVSVYAKVKKEIEYLQELLKNNSIKEKPALYFDLTKILSDEHSSLALLSSIIDTVISIKIQQLQIDPYWQNPEKWRSTPSFPAIVNIYRDPADPRQIICEHSHHENLLSFKSYNEICVWISLLKADIAYFNNIEHAEVWVKGFSHLSEESMKSFKFFVDVHKITDETYLNILEKIEQKLREQFINIKMGNLRKHTAVPLLRPPQSIASSLPHAAGNVVSIGSSSQPNPQSSYRQQESSLPTIPTPLPTLPRQPNMPTTLPQSPVPPCLQSLNEILTRLIKEKNEAEIFKFIVRHLDCIETKHINHLLMINQISDPTRALIDVLGLLETLIREETSVLKAKMWNLFKDSILQILYENSLTNHRQQETNLPTIQTPLPSPPQRQPSLPTTLTQLPAAPSQAISHTNSSSNNSSQVLSKESNKRKKSSTTSSKKGKKKSVKKPSTRRSKKSKTKTTAESPSENVPPEEAVQKNQTTTTQKETPSAERVEAPINREENLEKKRSLIRSIRLLTTSIKRFRISQILKIPY